MQSFNWVDIDGIRYSWDGQDSIVCSGRFGYQATMTGGKLNGLELEEARWDVAGLLDVDCCPQHPLYAGRGCALAPHGGAGWPPVGAAGVFIAESEQQHFPAGTAQSQ